MGTEAEISLGQVADKLREILSAHREEIEEAFLARMQNPGIPEMEVPEFDAEGLVGMRASAEDSLSALIESFEQGEDWEPALPPALAAQIRYTARRGVPLEVILRSASVFGAIFIDALIRGLDDRYMRAAIQYMAWWQSRNQDKVMAAFAAEYTNEAERLSRSPTHELREQVKGLLEGQPWSGGALDYQLDACHIGMVVAGKKVDLIFRRLAESLGCDLLVVPDAEDTYWLWLGAQRRMEFSDVERSASASTDSLVVGSGEPRDGVVGWRLSHVEAEAAMPVALLEGPGLLRHSNVALLAGALRHEAIGKSLIDRYLAPIGAHRDSEELRRTLRVYFELNCNAVSTASSLGVNRHTVQRRLKRVEEAIGEPAAARQAEFGVALRLQELTARTRAAIG